MSAGGEDHEHLGIRDAGLVHFVKQERHENLAVGDAGGIVDDETNRLPGLHGLPKRLGSLRMADGLENRGFRGRKGEGIP